MIVLFYQLFITFFLIGLLTIGGGYAMIPFIHQLVVVEHEWINDAAFTNIIAISQMTPGPIGINSATYLGYTVINNAGGSQLLSVFGSFTSTVAVMMPSVIIMLIIAKAYLKVKESEIFKMSMKGVKPVVVGLIGAAALLLMTKNNFPDWKSWLIFAIAFASLMWLKINPVLIIVIAGACGLLIY